jgi:hypothetical protein
LPFVVVNGFVAARLLMKGVMSCGVKLAFEIA